MRVHHLDLSSRKKVPLSCKEYGCLRVSSCSTFGICLQFEGWALHFTGSPQSMTEHPECFCPLQANPNKQALLQISPSGRAETLLDLQHSLRLCLHNSASALLPFDRCRPLDCLRSFPALATSSLFSLTPHSTPSCSPEDPN